MGVLKVKHNGENPEDLSVPFHLTFTKQGDFFKAVLGGIKPSQELSLRKDKVSITRSAEL